MNISTTVKTTLILFLCLLGKELSAQQNFTKGFIVSLKGDTTKGLIDYKNWRKSPTTILFKGTEDAVETSYTAENISAFGVKLGSKTEYYKAAKVSIENSAETIDKMDYTRQFNTADAYIFLLKLYSGTYNLYSYTNEKEHLFISKDNVTSELLFKSYLQGNTVIKVEQFKNQLSDLLKSCTKISAEEINNIEFRSSALINILRRFDDCMGAKSEIQVINEKPKLKFGLILSTDISTLRISRSNGDLKFNSSGNFSFGTSLALVLPKNNQSSSINLEILYRKYAFKKTIENIIDKDQYYIYHFNFSGSYLKTNVFYRYQFTLAKLKPFINLGVSQAFNSSKVDRTTTEKKFYGSYNTYADPVLAEERSYEQGLNLGFGINVKKINIELRGESTNGYSNFPGTKTAINSLYLNLNYIF